MIEPLYHPVTLAGRFCNGQDIHPEHVYPKHGWAEVSISLSAEQFWAYSTAVYGYEPVKSLCLESQDQYGADVNLILLCAWLDTQGVHASDAIRDALIACSQKHQNNSLEPLRAKRRALTRGSAEYANALLIELEAEKAAQKDYIALLNRFDARSGAAQSSWADWYWTHIGRPPIDIESTLKDAHRRMKIIRPT